MMTRVRSRRALVAEDRAPRRAVLADEARVGEGIRWS